MKNYESENKILIIDDEIFSMDAIEMTLQSIQLSGVIKCFDSNQVENILSKNQVDLIILDIIMPEISGKDLLIKIKRKFPNLPVIMITGVNEIETAVWCLKNGAFDYILKPIVPERLKNSVKHALEIIDIKNENENLVDRFLATKLKYPDAFKNIITINPNMKSIFRYIEAISTTSHPVLITGETGVGKELIAKAIHKVSGRAGELVSVNVAGLDENIFSDTLFGHIKGAYTGADDSRLGLIEKASNGTLFLDEIGDLSYQSQVKLLRLVQENEYLPLGSDVPKRSNARIITSTCKKLNNLIDLKQFRNDLFFRLKTHHINVPSLNKRKNDIRLLTNYFLEQSANELEKTIPAIPKELYILLENYNFSGNIRELKSLIFDALSTHPGKMLSLDKFKQHMKINSTDFLSKKIIESPKIFSSLEQLPTLKQSEQLLITEALERSNNNISIAASFLGITRQALSQRLKK